MSTSEVFRMEEFHHEPHEPHEPIRTTTRYVQKVRDVRVVRGKNFSFAIFIILIALTVFVSCENIFINSILPSRVKANSVKYESSDAEGKTYILVITGKTSRAAYTGTEGDSYVLTIKQQGQPDKESKGVVTTIGADGSLTLKPTKADSVPFGVSVSSGKMTAITGTITLDDGMTVSAPGAVTPVGNSGGPFTSVADMAEWLKAQPANTAATAYTVKLNVTDLTGLGNALRTNETKFVSLDLSDSTITSIPDYGPEGIEGVNNNITGIIIPNSVISIGYAAFGNLTNLTNLTIPASVTSIGAYIFGGSDNLTSVKFDGTITEANFNSGQQIGDLRTKYLEGGPGTYTTTAPVSDSSVWTKQSGNSGGPFTSVADMEAWLSVQPANTPDKPYTVKLNVSDLGGRSDDPGSAGYVIVENFKYVNLDLSGSTITSLGIVAFGDCDYLTGIIIPASVTSIGNQAFHSPNLTSVTFQCTITNENFNDSAFFGDLRDQYVDPTNGGIGTYTTPETDRSNKVWTKL